MSYILSFAIRVNFENPRERIIRRLQNVTNNAAPKLLYSQDVKFSMFWFAS